MVKESERIEKATFAGGCFWCTEADFEKLPGVTKVVSGYTGGREEKVSYEEVSSGLTGHREAIQVQYDPSKITYEELLDYFWKHIDPTDSGGNSWIEALNIEPPSSTTMINRDDWQKDRRRR